MNCSTKINTLISVVLTVLISFNLCANPTGEVVVGGSATFSRVGSVLNVNQTTDRAVINWAGFSIALGETTNFNQPSANAAVLNRVTGVDPSSIFGTLNANGNVYLINENGILVGASGVINTNSFIASTLDVNDADFMAGGDLLFQGTSMAGIRIEGTINALGGDVILMSREVSNTGTIKALDGTVALAGGTEVLLRETGSERVYVRAASAEGMVENSGLLDAARAELKAMGGNIYAMAINNSGVVRAAGVKEHEGQVWLVATGGSVVNTGKLYASKGSTGGDIYLSGSTVTTTGSTINAYSDSISSRFEGNEYISQRGTSNIYEVSDPDKVELNGFEHLGNSHNWRFGDTTITTPVAGNVYITETATPVTPAPVVPAAAPAPAAPTPGIAVDDEEVKAKLEDLLKDLNLNDLFASINGHLIAKNLLKRIHFEDNDFANFKNKSYLAYANFKVSLPDNSTDTIITQGPIFSALGNRAEEGSVGNFDRVDVNLTQHGYNVRFRERPQGFETRHINKDNKYAFNIVLESSYVEFLSHENDLMDLTMLSDNTVY